MLIYVVQSGVPRFVQHKLNVASRSAGHTSPFSGGSPLPKVLVTMRTSCSFSKSGCE